MIDLIVTRHAALIELLIERGIATKETPVKAHATEMDVRNKIVAGILPPHLATLAHIVVDVPLDLAPEDRGKELSIERMREVAGNAVYRVVLTFASIEGAENVIGKRI